MRLHPITVDKQEKSPTAEVQVTRLNALGVPARIGSLSVGDFSWVCEPELATEPWWRVVVERKSIRDFISSLPPNGRLVRFVDETGGVSPDEYMLRVLLLEGSLDEAPRYARGEQRFSPGDLDNLLATMQMLGIVVIRSKDAANTAGRLASFYRYTGKSDHRTLAQVIRPPIQGFYTDLDKKEAVRMVMGLPGWGEKKAKTALKEFGSPREVFAAVLEGDKKAFSKVRGIGPLLVKRAKEFLEKEVW